MFDILGGYTLRTIPEPPVGYSTDIEITVNPTVGVSYRTVFARGEAGTSILNIDWGDGNVQNYNLVGTTPNVINYTYSISGSKTIRVTSDDIVGSILFGVNGTINTIAKILTGIQKFRALTAKEILYCFAYAETFNGPILATFSDEDLPLVENFSYCFSHWSTFNQPLPQNFMSGNYPNVTNFQGCFDYWTVFDKALPQNFMSGNYPNTTRFTACFRDWQAFNQPLPQSFMSGSCSSVTEFSVCFYNWRSFNQPLPVGFMSGNYPSVITFALCFYNWVKYIGTIPIVKSLKSNVAFNQCYYGNSSMTGNGMPVVNNAVVPLGTISQCFNGCTSLSDYAQIPSGWK